MKMLSDYNNKRLCECFRCFNMKQPEHKDISEVNIELKDMDDISFVVLLERGKFLSYFGTRFAKIDEQGIIHIFKDYMG